MTKARIFRKPAGGLPVLLPVVLLAVFAASTGARAAENRTVPSITDSASVYELNYREKEPGVDPYDVRFLVSKRFIRIDETGESSGYIIFDDDKQTIFSVSHYDKRILVIRPQPSSKASPVESKVEYLALSDAPKVADRAIYNYRMFVEGDDGQTTCAELQIVEGLLPDVTTLLKRYQQVLSSQQRRLLKKTIQEVRTACYLTDQIYNEGLYYDKGLPIQEWHSNEKSRMLVDYRKTEVDAHLFDLPENYERFSLD